MRDERLLANKAGHRAPHEPPWKLFHQSRWAFHDHGAAPQRRVILDVAEPQTVEVREIRPDNEIVRLTCNFIYLCTGYYNYEKGYTPEWPGMNEFAGRMIVLESR